MSGAKGETQRRAVAVPNQHIFLLTVGSEKATAQTLAGLRPQIRPRKVVLCKRSITNPALRNFYFGELIKWIKKTSRRLEKIKELECCVPKHTYSTLKKEHIR